MTDPTTISPTTSPTGSTTRTTTRPGSSTTTNRTIDVSGSSSHGTTTIQDDVVAKIAGIAAREVRGVHALGGGAARALGALRDRVGRTDLTQGVAVEVGERQAAVDVVLVVEYGTPIQDVASQVRRSVTTGVEELAGLEVTEVNILVSDVFLPGDDVDETEPRRVQ